MEHKLSATTKLSAEHESPPIASVLVAVHCSFTCLSGTLPVNISSKIKESPLKAVRGTKPEGLDLWIAPSETGGSRHTPKYQARRA